MSHDSLSDKPSIARENSPPERSENVQQTFRRFRTLEDHLGATLSRDGCDRNSQEEKDEDKDEESSAAAAAWAIYCQERKAGGESSLPLADYLQCAFRELVEERKQRPAWHTPLFHLVRLLKAHPELRDLEAAEALGKVESTMSTLSTQTESSTCPALWIRYAGVARADAQAEFIDAWPKVRYPAGQSVLYAAALAAERCPLALEEEVQRRRYVRDYASFISLAGWLQTIAGCRAICLPVEAVAGQLGVQPRTVSRYCSWAIEDGYLRKVKGAEYRGQRGKGRAAEYAFNVARFPVLVEQVEAGTIELFAGGAPAAHHGAREVVSHYQRVIACPHSAAGAERAVETLIEKGATVENLKQATELYLQRCQRNGQAGRFRLAARTFFEQGYWQDELGFEQS